MCPFTIKSLEAHELHNTQLFYKYKGSLPVLMAFCLHMHVGTFELTYIILSTVSCHINIPYQILDNHEI
jgi:hypothetical protein